MLQRLMHRPLACAAGAAAFVLSAICSAAPISEQIIVDQFGWRANAPRKVAIFADPITGQNSAIAYTPGATFEIRRASDNATVFTGSVTSWKAGTTQTQSGDKVWYGDFSSLTTPGTYYVFDPANNLQSYNFKLDDAVFAPVLRNAASARSTTSGAAPRSPAPTAATGTIRSATRAPTRTWPPCSGSTAPAPPAPPAMSMAAGTMPAT